MNTLAIIFSAALTNNFVLVKFLGLCPVMGVSKNFKNALGLAFATTLVLTISAATCFLITKYLLQPYDLEFLKIIVFIFTIAALVQLTEILLRNLTPLLYRVLGIYLPLITTNCSVLAVALLVTEEQNNLSVAIGSGLGAGIGFAIVLIIFSSIRERLTSANIPKCFQGAPIAFISIGILALAFSGLAGIFIVT